MISKLVFKNLKSNKNNILTYILANSVIYAVVFVIYSLSTNPYVLEAHHSLLEIILFGALVLSFVSIVFTLYSQRFLFKRRFRELSLYQVLGLQKKHIVKMLYRESVVIFIVTAVLTTIIGYVFGLISFFVLRLILDIQLEAFRIFDFNVPALIVTVFILLVSFTLNILINVFHVAKKTPTELLSYEKDAEKEPKANIVRLIFGLIILSFGYFLALTIKEPQAALFFVFVATILVIIATYLLFTSLSIFLLKTMRKNKRYYYKKENFLSISNLLYRMKSNAVSLATITVFCSAVILVITTSYTLGQIYKEAQPDYDYELTYSIFYDSISEESIESYIRDIDTKLVDSISRSYFPYYSKRIDITASGDFVLELSNSWDKSINYTYFTLTTREYYEKAFNTKLDDLADNEVFLFSNNEHLYQLDEIILNNKTYKTKMIEDKTARHSTRIKAFVVVDDFTLFDEILTICRTDRYPRVISGEMAIAIKINEKKSQELTTYFSNFARNNGMTLTSYKEIQEENQSFSGGFFFLGVLISIVLTVITSLVLYYKQISEAEEDRSRYLILKKLGVSDKMATKTIKRQMRSVFLSPVIVAIIHNIFASQIISKMLLNFEIISYITYFKNLVVIISIFLLVYLLAYLVAQKFYKTITWRNLEQ